MEERQMEQQAGEVGASVPHIGDKKGCEVYNCRDNFLSPYTVCRQVSAPGPTHTTVKCCNPGDPEDCKY